MKGLNPKIKFSKKWPFNRLQITEGIDQKVQIPIDLFNEMFDCLTVIEFESEQYYPKNGKLFKIKISWNHYWSFKCKK